jgi:hypothetical protein
MRLLGSIYWVTGALAGVSALIWLFKGCRHPNPHFVKQETRRDEATGEEVVHPAHYCCYECGKTWLARQRDPAWTASPLVQKYHGYDERKAVRAAKRSVLEERQRRFLAVRRIGGPAPKPPIQFDPTPARRRPTEVVDLSTRKPA